MFYHFRFSGPAVLKVSASVPSNCAYANSDTEIYFRATKKSMTEPITSLFLSPLRGHVEGIGKPPALFLSDSYARPYMCNRVVNSKHGPRVPVPIQVVSYVSPGLGLLSPLRLLPRSLRASANQDVARCLLSTLRNRKLF